MGTWLVVLGRGGGGGGGPRFSRLSGVIKPLNAGPPSPYPSTLVPMAVSEKALKFGVWVGV